MTARTPSSAKSAMQRIVPIVFVILVGLTRTASATCFEEKRQDGWWECCQAPGGKLACRKTKPLPPTTNPSAARKSKSLLWSDRSPPGLNIELAGMIGAGPHFDGKSLTGPYAELALSGRVLYHYWTRDPDEAVTRLLKYLLQGLVIGNHVGLEVQANMAAINRQQWNQEFIIGARPLVMFSVDRFRMTTPLGAALPALIADLTGDQATQLQGQFGLNFALDIMLSDRIALELGLKTQYSNIGERTGVFIGFVLR